MTLVLFGAESWMSDNAYWLFPVCAVVLCFCAWYYGFRKNK